MLLCVELMLSHVALILTRLQQLVFRKVMTHALSYAYRVIYFANQTECADPEAPPPLEFENFT